jgi:DNA (cytosine-5)-methyltransferase 1
MLTSRGLGRVLGDLASMGFDARWGVLGAADIGANHQRDRIWIVGKVGDTSGVRRQVDSGSISTKNENSQQNSRGRGTFDASENECSWTLANPLLNGLQRIGEDGGTEGSAGLRSREGSNKIQDLFGSTKEWWSIEPDVGRVADGVAARVDRLKAIGNGQVPLCAATAWRLLSERHA